MLVQSNRSLISLDMEIMRNDVLQCFVRYRHLCVNATLLPEYDTTLFILYILWQDVSILPKRKRVKSFLAKI